MHLLTWVLISFSIKVVFCWDNEELELFDLVEEINENFYDVLGVAKVDPMSHISYRTGALDLGLNSNSCKA